MNNIRTIALAVMTVFGVLILSQTAKAQTPPCSNKWMEIHVGVLTPGPLVKPGLHKIWVGKKDARTGVVSNWKAYGPFQVIAGRKYLAVMQNQGSVSALLANDAAIGRYNSPAGNVSAIYYQNKAGNTGPYAICTELINTAQLSACSNLIGVWEGISGDNQFREVIYITEGANGLGVWGEWFDKRTGAKRGAFSSSNYRCQNGHLLFHQSYTPKPDPRWAPDNDLDLSTDGQTLFIKHRYGSSQIRKRS